MQFKEHVGESQFATPNARVASEARSTHAPAACSGRAEEPIASDDIGLGAAHRSDEPAAPVFDEVQMSKFVALMGPDWVARNLAKFAIDVEGRLAALDAASPSDLAAIAHGMIMMPAQCGFTELLDIAELVQREARQGAGLNRIPELRAAGERALAVMRTYTPRA